MKRLHVGCRLVAGIVAYKIVADVTRSSTHIHRPRAGATSATNANLVNGTSKKLLRAIVSFISLILEREYVVVVDSGAERRRLTPCGVLSLATVPSGRIAR